jgi:hypothetical protein
VIFLDRGHARFRRAICLEAVCCFGPPAAVLLLGTVIVPSVSAYDWDPWVLAVFGQMLLGWAGLVGIARVLFVLCGEDEFRGGVTLPAVACGVVAILPVCLVARDISLWVILLIVGAPLACTAHLLFLARLALFR